MVMIDKSWHKYIYGTKIEFKLPGLNEYSAAERTHYHSAAKLKKKTQEDIKWFLKGNVHIQQKVIIVFRWHEKIHKNGQSRDMDNVAFAKKFILDAMQEIGMIENDDHNHIAGFYDDFHYGKDEEYGVEVEIYEE